ncbi:MAG: 23S rRNA (adenine(2503)-C(2))-methyltransferase RlmN [Candidatus Solibacter usitatus]|nr:23S rRNA (adenine(2503)-C(2))-methyltransferase RlmN [Candidatus Solibacter usitatus]
MDLADLRTLLPPGEPAFRAQQIYDALYSRRVRTLAEIPNLPRPLRQHLESSCIPGHLRQDARYQSADGTRRYLLGLADSKSVEAVFMPEDSRDTLCISTQVGCPVDCKFCLTALMGLERNLTAGEIAGQVLHLAGDNGLWAHQKRINVVMMGQGEPLLNLDQVLKATRLLCDPQGLNVSPRRITLSTSGLIPKIAEIAASEVRPRLAVSLNASTEEQRRELMPVTRKYHLADLLETCRAYPLRSWEKLTFEYVLLKGVNDTDADARRVVRLLARINCKVNLIALNPGPGIPFETPGPERVTAFQAILRNSFPAFIRRPRGLDIFAACGQLKRMESGLVELPPPPS